MSFEDRQGAIAPATEDRLRAEWYCMLGRLLSRPPDKALLDRIVAMKGDDTQLGRQIDVLATAARATTSEAVEEEYFDLFIGVGRAELLPFASYYLAGFLNERPLAQLRGDMGRLGIARVESVKEPEDHVATLFEIMSGLITGAFGTPLDLAEQRRFFDAHIGCWAPRFFDDLQAARSAVFYMPVGSIGASFLAIESQAFDMAA
jgi:TorA maturation chaperone TorD